MRQLVNEIRIDYGFNILYLTKTTKMYLFTNAADPTLSTQMSTLLGKGGSHI